MSLFLDGRLAAMPAEYFQIFAVPDDPTKPHCLKCKTELFYSFRWGIVHGEGVCGKCGWPTRLYHFVKQPDGTEVRIAQLLQYHPSGIKGQHNRKLPKWPAPENDKPTALSTSPDGEQKGADKAQERGGKL